MSSSNSVRSSQPPADPAPHQPTGIAIDCEDRWQVYHRLQELDITCQCGGFQPLKVTIQTATEALQLWSIIKRVSQPRTDLVITLTKSWQLPCSYTNGHR
ncbi:Asr1405/Asl0597 family protein [Leptolyngbya sp. BC1307]|uniref:Asr1405/Asl0597 family protein n=1 Tax=Leptolyngbya sp. BC1307 TaxID=2029589 RepID=UPI001F0A9706|nr:Asr1405/Asl0597 family protein [Leptolyngbya sp. BC1307]